MEEVTLETLSKLWWGNSLRLRASAWIRNEAGRDAFYQRQVARELATEAAYVRREFELLVAAGAITAEPQQPGERRVFYLANQDHPLWKVVDAAILCVDDMQSLTD